MSEAAAGRLCGALRAELERDAGGPGVAALLEAYAGEHDDWCAFRLFDERCYARNLIACSDLFELMVICWNAGQTSPIHDHDGQRCWMAVLEGAVEEILYEHPVPGHPGALRTTDSRTYVPGQVSYIHDDLGLHAIRPAAGGPAATLHMYSRPIKTCNVYCPDSGRIEPRELSYHSIDGRPITTRRSPTDTPPRPDGEGA